jgi:hypothetical protein
MDDIDDQAPSSGSDANRDARRTAQKAGVRRFSLNLTAESADTLERTAAARGTNFTEALRRAVAVTAALDEELRQGNEIQIVSPDGAIKKLVLV